MITEEVKRQRNKAAIEFQNRMIGFNVWHSCSNCNHRMDNRCIKFGATPPIEVAAVGCEEYEYSTPF